MVSGVVEVRITEGSPVGVQSDAGIRFGDVAGDVRAGMNVECPTVGGNGRAGMAITYGDVLGDVNAGMDLSMGGGDVTRYRAIAAQELVLGKD
ncbi:hypothetical protein MRF4_17180 [Methylobacterium radiotolerans]|uniref:hypothetical protein n=1 Tax=Methylobacterium TaxID=407 RepID=UPI002F2D8D36